MNSAEWSSAADVPHIERWDNLPEAVRQHLIDRMRDRAISASDLNQLRRWIETRPEVPEGEWYKDFGSFKICGRGSSPRRSCSKGKPQRVNRCDHRLTDFSPGSRPAFTDPDRVMHHPDMISVAGIRCRRIRLEPVHVPRSTSST